MNPGTHRWTQGRRRATVQEQRRGSVGHPFSMHRMQEAEIIDVLCNVREKFRHRVATFAVSLEFPRRFHHSLRYTQLAGVGKTSSIVERQHLTVTFVQQRLLIKAVDMTDPPLHEEEDHPFCSRRVMQCRFAARRQSRQC